jgi:hypothetical protein
VIALLFAVFTAILWVCREEVAELLAAAWDFFGRGK